MVKGLNLGEGRERIEDQKIEEKLYGKNDHWEKEENGLKLREEAVEKRKKDGSLLSSTQKPVVVMEYNKSKQGIDVSDQMSSYYTVLRKTTKWYKKVAFEYLLGISITNAFHDNCGLSYL